MRKILAALFVLALCVPAMASRLDVTVSPESLTWNENAWVGIAISNVLDSEEIELLLYADINRNGMVETSDFPVASFNLTNGETNWLGAASFPADEDGLAANGAIQTRISYYGGESFRHIIGSYLWVARSVPNGDYAMDPFSVTQPTSTVYITGQVKTGGSSNPVPGAIVFLEPFLDDTHLAPACWAGTSGMFRLDLPADCPPSGAGAVAALAPGYFSVPSNPFNGDPISRCEFDGPLSNGNNALSNSLFVLGPLQFAVYRVSGHVYDSRTNPVAATLVKFEPDDEDSDAESIAFTDTNGYYSLCVSTGLAGVVFTENEALTMRGLVGTGEPVEINGDQTVDLFCPQAEILVRAEVRDRESGDPLPGVNVFIGGDRVGGDNYTLPNGTAEIGMVAGTDYEAGAEEGLGAQHYLCPDAIGGLAITNPGVFTGPAFDVERGGVISGTVYDQETNALAGGRCGAFPYPSEDGWWEYNSGMDFAGNYEMLLPVGTYAVAANCDGYIQMNYTSHYTWEWDNGVVADPVVVATAGLEGIDFLLPEAAYIRGHVDGDGAPLADASARAEFGWEWRDETSTDTNGDYELQVPGGASYTVSAAGPDGTFFISQYYDHTGNGDDAAPVFTDVGAPATNINFDLLLGGRIEGAVYEPDGVTPLTNTWGWIEARTTNDDSNGSAGGGDVNRDDGTYSLVAPAGTYRVRAEADGWLEQYYAGFYDFQESRAHVVTVRVEEVTGGIDFTMMEPGYIEGHVRCGATNLAGVAVSVNYVADTNDWNREGVGEAESDGDGFYSVAVPPLSNLLVQAEPPAGSFFVGEYWSNTLDEAEGMLVSVVTGATLPGIDFDLDLGMRIAGRVTDAAGNSLNLNGMTITALIETNGYHEGRAWGYTDTDGYYEMSVSAATSYIVQVQRPWYVVPEEWWYPKLYYSNTIAVFSGQKISAAPGETVDHIDFRLTPGGQVRGQVYFSDGSTPAPNSFVSVYDGSNIYQFDEPGEADSAYLVTVPTNAPFFFRAHAQDCVQEYHDNVYDFPAATPVQSSLMTTVRVDFALYGLYEDTDGDLLYNHQEDSRPDGVYNPAEDWASYTTNDTDGDMVTDNNEQGVGTSPKLPDTDGDTYTDYQEVYITRTDPTATPAGSNSYLRCARAARSGADVIVTWDSVPTNGNYHIERATSLLGAWTHMAGPIQATSTVMSVTDYGAPPGAAYRIRMP